MRTDIISVDSAPGGVVDHSSACLNQCLLLPQGRWAQAGTGLDHPHKRPYLAELFSRGSRMPDGLWPEAQGAELGGFCPGRLRLVFPIFQVQVEFLSCSSGLFFSLFPGSFLMYFKGRLCTFHLGLSESPLPRGLVEGASGVTSQGRGLRVSWDCSDINHTRKGVLKCGRVGSMWRF